MRNTVQNTQELRNDMRIFLCIIALLLVIGTVFIYSSSYVYALERHASAPYFLKKHCMGLFIGFCAAFIASHIPVKILQKITPLCFFTSLMVTALTLIPAFSLRVHGSSRWLAIGHWSFQPSELLKVSLLLYVAHFLSKHTSSQVTQTSHSLRSFGVFVIALAIPSIILLKQPDFGFTVTLVSTALIVCCLAQFNVRRIAMSMLGIIPLVIGLVWLQPYRMKRITVFLNPWHDPQGSGFQIIQSLIAIGSGGLSGIGIGQSRQKFFYLPMQHTDFIFSIIAEETGFVGLAILLMLYLAALYTGLRIACKLSRSFSRFFVLGFITFVSLQAIINMAVASGLAPTKGIGLPFISYGNTSLVTYLLMVGIMLAMIKEDRQGNHSSV